MSKQARSTHKQDRSIHFKASKINSLQSKLGLFISKQARSKIFEKVIFYHTYKYFQNQKLFYNAQYGFRTKHSSEYAALELIDQVINEMDNDKIPFSIFLDLSKAFDTLDHTILLEKLRYYGVDGAVPKLFESYLKDRKQYVDIDGTSSEMKPIITGAP